MDAEEESLALAWCAPTDRAAVSAAQSAFSARLAEAARELERRQIWGGMLLDAAREEVMTEDKVMTAMEGPLGFLLTRRWAMQVCGGAGVGGVRSV
jgi:hypothetical protein